MSDHHYYGTTSMDWVVGPTEEYVLKKLARFSGARLIKDAVKCNKGLLVQVCKVNLPQAAHYSISDYLPNKITKEDGVNETRKGERVPIEGLKAVRLVNSLGKHIPA